MRNAVSETVRKLRGSFGETQEEFARRMDTAVVTIARWETSRPPRGKALKALAELARSKSLPEYADVFEQAARGEIPPLRRTVKFKEIEPQDEEEASLFAAVARINRNRGEYRKDFSRLKKAVERAMNDINELVAEAQASADVRQAIVRLFQEGKTDDEIAALFNLNPEHVKQMLVFHRMEARLREASK